MHSRLSLYIHLLPVFGFFPSLWTLYRRRGSPDRQAASRLAVILALAWLSGHFLLQGSAIASEMPTLPLLIGSSVWTTTYFLVNFGLMMRLWKRQPLWLPGVSRIGDRLP